MTQEQLDAAVEMLKPGIAVVLELRPDQDLFMSMSCDAVGARAQVLHVEIKLDGKDLTDEQAQKVGAFLHMEPTIPGVA